MAAFPPPRTTAVSFDTRKGETTRIYQDFTTAHYMRCSFPNGDGTWTSVLHVPGEALVRWDPRRENIDVTVLSSRIDPHAAAGTTQRLLRWQGRVYFPHRGWFDTRSMKCVDGPRPEKELTWFAIRGETAFGVEWKKGTISVGAWDFASGHVRDVCDIQDSQVHNVNLSASGKVIAVNTYGVFHRFDAESGALEMCKVLPTDGVGVVDCLCRIDKERLLGTPFITQRFWEVNLRTGDGMDCGRAAPGAGEILQVWKLGGKIYMAAYTGGELMEYDPRRHPHYPENPRVVASPPHAMRPVAAATDGRHIFYACSAPYGNLGSVVTRYDTKTGLASYRVNPLPEQQIRSLYYDRSSGNLLCGTTMHSDCQSCPPASDECYLACLDAETLEVRQQIAAPKGTEVASVVGAMRTGEVLCTFTGSQGLRWCSVKPGHLELPPEDKIKSFAEGVHQIVAAGRPGLFVLRLSDRVELWDMRRSQCVKTLLQGINKRFYVYRVVVQERSVYVVTPRHVIVLEDVL